MVFYCEEEEVIFIRRTKFVNNEYYHIYNRGVDKRDVFLDTKDYIRFIVSMREFNRIKPIGSLYYKNKLARQGIRNPLGVSDSCSKIVEIIAYCLNPNHYHFILKQLEDDGITNFMRKVGIGYTNYFNKKTQSFWLPFSRQIQINPHRHRRIPNLALSLHQY